MITTTATLWETALTEGTCGDRFALTIKAHTAIVAVVIVLISAVKVVSHKVAVVVIINDVVHCLDSLSSDSGAGGKAAP